MQNVENVQQQNKHQIYNQSQHHNKPTTSIKSNIKKSNKDFDTRSLGSVSQSISDNLSSSVKDTSRSSIARVAISSKSNSTERLSQIKSLQPAASAVSLKQTHATGEIIFNPDSGLVKFFLRGRPVNFYTNQMATNSNEMGFVFDLESKLKAPKQELKLEWVYGYRGKDCRSNLYQLPTGK
jgi:microtubule-associated protein-like 1/2